MDRQGGDAGGVVLVEIVGGSRRVKRPFIYCAVLGVLYGLLLQVLTNLLVVIVPVSLQPMSLLVSCMTVYKSYAHAYLLLIVLVALLAHQRWTQLRRQGKIEELTLTPRGPKLITSYVTFPSWLGALCALLVFFALRVNQAIQYAGTEKTMKMLLGYYPNSCSFLIHTALSVLQLASIVLLVGLFSLPLLRMCRFPSARYLCFVLAVATLLPLLTKIAEVWASDVRVFWFQGAQVCLLLSVMGLADLRLRRREASR